MSGIFRPRGPLRRITANAGNSGVIAGGRRKGTGVAPGSIAFVGPPIANIAGATGVPITAVPTAGLFANDTGAAVFAKVGIWPSWLALSAIGTISGTPTGAGNHPNVQVSCTEAGKGGAVSNAFAVTAT